MEPDLRGGEPAAVGFDFQQQIDSAHGYHNVRTATPHPTQVKHAVAKDSLQRLDDGVLVGVHFGRASHAGACSTCCTADHTSLIACSVALLAFSSPFSQSIRSFVFQPGGFSWRMTRP